MRDTDSSLLMSLNRLERSAALGFVAGGGASARDDSGGFRLLILAADASSLTSLRGFRD